MNQEFLSRFRTAIIMILTVIITAAILYISWKNGNIDYLDRALYFFSGMMIFVLCRNLVKSIKIDNKQFGISLDAGVEDEINKNKEKSE